MASEEIRISQTRSKLWIDIVIFIVFLILMEPHLSDLPVHEWLSLSMIFGMTVHLLVNWNWVAQVTRRFLGKLSGQTRINYVLNWLFFLDGTLIMVSGIMISEVAIPAMGLELPIGRGWYKLHDLSTNMALFLLGVHTALHWNWVVSTFTRHITQPFVGMFTRKSLKGGLK